MVDEGFGGGDPKVRLAQLQEALLRDCRYVVGDQAAHRGLDRRAGGQAVRREGLPGAGQRLRGVAPGGLQPDLPVLHARQAPDPGAPRRVPGEEAGGDAPGVPRRLRRAGRPADPAGAGGAVPLGPSPFLCLLVFVGSAMRTIFAGDRWEEMVRMADPTGVATDPGRREEIPRSAAETAPAVESETEKLHTKLDEQKICGKLASVGNSWSSATEPPSPVPPSPAAPRPSEPSERAAERRNESCRLRLRSRATPDPTGAAGGRYPGAGAQGIIPSFHPQRRRPALPGQRIPKVLPCPTLTTPSRPSKWTIAPSATTASAC